MVELILRYIDDFGLNLSPVDCSSAFIGKIFCEIIRPSDYQIAIIVILFPALEIYGSSFDRSIIIIE
jgi:hypothetical protein